MAKGKDDLVRVLRKVRSREIYASEKELADLRQEYYAMSPAKREKFKQDMARLADACKPVSWVLDYDCRPLQMGGKGQRRQHCRFGGSKSDAGRNSQGNRRMGRRR